MTNHPKIQLSRLRDIGWTTWDPIGLQAIDGGWQESSAPDEYDTYLLHVVGMIRRGCAVEECADYLEQSEVGRMGLSVTATTNQRATATVMAVVLYLAELPDGPLQIR